MVRVIFQVFFRFLHGKLRIRDCNASNAPPKFSAATRSVTKPVQKSGQSRPTKKASKEKVKKGPTKEDLAAIVIQKYVRRFMAICALKTLRRKRDEYDELIDKMQHQAYLDMVNAEREVGIDILEF